ncbi:LPXTG cell wall anchor domain-containing protein [Carnobacterium maltaromaticum]
MYAPLNQGTVNQKYTLPQTGEQLPINMMITGFVLLGLAYIVRKQKI